MISLGGELSKRGKEEDLKIHGNYRRSPESRVELKRPKYQEKRRLEGQASALIAPEHTLPEKRRIDSERRGVGRDGGDT